MIGLERRICALEETKEIEEKRRYIFIFHEEEASATERAFHELRERVGKDIFYAAIDSCGPWPQAQTKVFFVDMPFVGALRNLLEGNSEEAPE